MKSFISVVDAAEVLSESSTNHNNRLSMAEQLIVAKHKPKPIPLIEHHMQQILAERAAEQEVKQQRASKIAKAASQRVLKENNAVTSEQPDQIDTVTMDIPLLMRVLEYAKEDAKTDMDLHNVVTKMIAFNKEKETLDMGDYDALISTRRLLTKT